MKLPVTSLRGVQLAMATVGVSLSTTRRRSSAAA